MIGYHYFKIKRSASNKLKMGYRRQLYTQLALHVFVLVKVKVKVKVNHSHYRPGVAQRVPGS